MPNPTDFLEPHFRPAWEAWKAAPNEQSTSHMLTTIQPAIDKAITLNIGPKSDPILGGHAKLLALQALETYDPSKASVGTHLTRHLQRLKRLNARQAQAIPIPEHWLISHNMIRRAEDELGEELGRAPTMQEIASHTKLPIDKIKQLRNVLFPAAESDLSPTGQNYVPSYIPGVQPGSTAWHEAVYSDLDPINQKIMEHTIGLHGQPILPNHHIAKMLNLSPGAISQRKARIQQILDKESELSPF